MDKQAVKLVKVTRVLGRTGTQNNPPTTHALGYGCCRVHGKKEGTMSK